MARVVRGIVVASAEELGLCAAHDEGGGRKGRAMGRKRDGTRTARRMR